MFQSLYGVRTHPIYTMTTKISFFVRLSAYLYSFTQNDTYLSSANSAHQFIQSHLYNSTTHSLQYKIHLPDCTYQDVPPFASDVGLYLEALTVLSQAANDEAMGKLLVSHELHILLLRLTCLSFLGLIIGHSTRFMEIGLQKMVPLQKVGRILDNRKQYLCPLIPRER